MRVEVEARAGVEDDFAHVVFVLWSVPVPDRQLRRIWVGVWGYRERERERVKEGGGEGGRAAVSGRRVWG